MSTGSIPGSPFKLADESLAVRGRRIALLGFPQAVDAELRFSSKHHFRTGSSTYDEQAGFAPCYTEGRIVSSIDEKNTCVASYTGTSSFCTMDERSQRAITIFVDTLISLYHCKLSIVSNSMV